VRYCHIALTRIQHPRSLKRPSSAAVAPDSILYNFGVEFVLPAVGWVTCALMKLLNFRAVNLREETGFCGAVLMILVPQPWMLLGSLDEGGEVGLLALAHKSQVLDSVLAEAALV